MTQHDNSVQYTNMQGGAGSDDEPHHWLRFPLHGVSLCLSLCLHVCACAGLFVSHIVYNIIRRLNCLEQAYAILSARDVKFLQFAADKSA